MSIKDAYGPDKFGLSFELFPPKTEKGDAALTKHVRRLAEFDPAYFTCTYGAGGSTQDKTLAIAAQIHRDLGLPVATHLTCVGKSPEELLAYLRDAMRQGVENVVALRGDPPEGEKKFTPIEGGFRYANELVAMVRRELPEMGVAVGGYPEVHQEAASPEADLENLKRKCDAGADVVITQLFYDNADFFRFRDHCVRAGITQPIVPGLLPVSNGKQIQRITALCGAQLPKAFVADLEAAGDDNQAQVRVGVDFATRQTQDLIDEHVAGIHWYVLNRSEVTAQVLEEVSLPKAAAAGRA